LEPHTVDRTQNLEYEQFAKLGELQLLLGAIVHEVGNFTADNVAARCRRSGVQNIIDKLVGICEGDNAVVCQVVWRAEGDVSQ
jgi:hypothetical protein